jgi:hypothetical protein
MGDQTIKVTELDLFDPFEMLLAHFEEDLDTPAFQLRNVLWGQACVIV